MPVSCIPIVPDHWLKSFLKCVLCRLLLVAAALAVSWSLAGILGERSGFVSTANAETPAEKCAKRGMVLVGHTCETPKEKAETPEERCAKRRMVLVGHTCETPKAKAETPEERCARQNKKC